MKRRPVMVIAGEASGDMLGAELVQSLKIASVQRGESTPLEFFGAGGPRLAAAGVHMPIDLTAHAVVGLWEVLRHYPKFRAFFRQLLELAVCRQPIAIILIDYPGFNLRFMAAIRRLERKHSGPFYNWRPQIIYYVSPQLWAWHETRVKQMEKDLDLLLSIFPFEPEWYRRRAPALRVEFVGHPVIDRYPQFNSRDAGRPTAEFSTNDPHLREATRKGSRPLLLLLPGSRQRELSFHGPVLAQAVRELSASRPLRFRCIVPGLALARLARKFFDTLPVEITTGNLAESLAEASLAIAASGTITVECALFGLPTIVIYKTSWLTSFLAKRFIKVNHLAMPNLLAGEAVFPELIQRNVTSENIIRASLSLLDHWQERERIRRKLGEVIRSLGEGGASKRAANVILDLLGANPPVLR